MVEANHTIIASRSPQACTASTLRKKARILVLQTGFLGDVILATALFEPLFSAGYEVYALVRPEHKPLIEEDSLIAQVLVDDKRGSRRGLLGMLNTARELRSYCFAAAISPHRSHRTSLMLALSGIPRRIGFNTSPFLRLFTDLVTPSRGCHQLERNLSLLEPLGISVSKPDMRLCVPEKASREASAILSGARGALVGVAPGSAWATKRWPPERFGQVLSHLRRSVEFTAVILGDETEREIAAQVAHQWDGPTIDLVGKTDLQTLCAVIQRLDLLICNDSAPVHIAGAYRIPTVAIFLATHPNFGFGPILQPFRIAQVEDLACRPCARHGGTRCPLGHFACAYRLEVQTVAAAAQELLARNHRR